MTSLFGAVAGFIVGCLAGGTVATALALRDTRTLRQELEAILAKSPPDDEV